MKLINLMSESYIYPSIKGKEKTVVLEELSEFVSKRAGNLVKDKVFKVLEEREKLGSTGIGYGIGIPHGKVENLDKIILFIAKSDEGVDFDSIDEKPVRIFFLLLAPENSVGSHLKALARISRMIRDPEFRDKLVNCRTSAEIFEIVTNEDEKVPL